MTRSDWLECIPGCPVRFPSARRRRWHAMAFHDLDAAGLRRAMSGGGRLKTETINDPIINRADRRGLAALLQRRKALHPDE